MTEETEMVTLDVKASEIIGLIDWLQARCDKPIDAITLLACTMLEIAKLVGFGDDEAVTVCMKVLNSARRNLH